MRSLVLLLSFLLFTGCVSLRPGSDPIVVRAEQTARIALDTFDTFLKFEFDNKDRISQLFPQVHQAAEQLRRDGPKWIATLRELTKAYKENRTAEAKANLITALAVVQTGIVEAQKYLTLAHP